MLHLVFNSMLRCGKIAFPRRKPLQNKLWNPLVTTKAGYVTKMPKDHDETDTEYDDRMECYFGRRNIDNWELRKGLNEMAGIDAVPEPRVVIAALYACRRVNDYAATIRLLEMVHMKCGNQVNIIWPYMLQELGPALDELGVDTPERMGYGIPELALVNVYEVN